MHTVDAMDLVENRGQIVVAEPSPPPSPKSAVFRDTSLLSLLRRAAATQPQNGLVFRDYSAESGFDELSYIHLLDIAMMNATTLLDRGIVKPRTPVVLFFEKYRDNIVWYWSVIAAGAIPALLPPAKGEDEARRKELEHVSQLFGRPNVLTTTSSAAQFSRHGGFRVICTDRISARQDLEHCTDPSNRNGAADSHNDEPQSISDTTCTILFTSGSTGPSKAVQFTHRQLLASSSLKCFQNGMDATDRFLCWISFDHSVAVCELHLQAMEAGASMFMIPGTEFTQDPLRFWSILSENDIAYTFAPNSFLAAAMQAYNDFKDRGGVVPAYSFENLKVLFCGGEANKTTTLRVAADFLSRHGAPEDAVTAVYGLSETCSALFYNREGPMYDAQRSRAFASVGLPLPTHEVRIVDEHLRLAERGAVQIRGPMIFAGYYNNVAATEACTTTDGWFDTGDIGTFDDQGHLMIIGRTKEVLVLNGQNFSSGELEYAIEASNIQGVETGYTASFSIWSDKNESEEVVILFNPAADRTDDTRWLRDTVDQIIKAVVGFCRRRPLVVIPLPRAKLPKSSIGKLSRGQLKSSFLAGGFDEFKLTLRSTQCHPDLFTNSRQRAIAEVFTDCLQIPESELSADLAIETLGIDSLGYLRLRSAIERAFSTTNPLSLTQLMACRCIRDIDSVLIETQKENAAPYNPMNVLRSTGSKTPLIICPTGNGGFLNYMSVWPLIPDRKIMALHARGLEPGHEPFASLAEMLDTYLDAIKEEQPLGPYALFGYCFGGTLAFELAKRLEALGDEVIFCAGVDSPADPSIMKQQRDFSYETYVLLGLLEVAGVIDHSDRPAILEKLATAPETRPVEATVPLLSPSALECAGLSMDRLKAWVGITKATHLLAIDYRPSGLIRTHDAFYINSPPPDSAISDNPISWRYVYIGDWKNYVAGASNLDVCFDYADTSPTRRADRPLRIHRVEGTHETAASQDHAESLAQKVTDALLLREEEWFRNSQGAK